jgi:hypothetical protein
LFLEDDAASVIHEAVDDEEDLELEDDVNMADAATAATTGNGSKFNP